jgi:Leucine-rich repeat (LRR) protein
MLSAFQANLNSRYQNLADRCHTVASWMRHFFFEGDIDDIQAIYNALPRDDAKAEQQAGEITEGSMPAPTLAIFSQEQDLADEKKYDSNDDLLEPTQVQGVGAVNSESIERSAADSELGFVFEKLLQVDSHFLRSIRWANLDHLLANILQRLLVFASLPNIDRRRCQRRSTKDAPGSISLLDSSIESQGALALGKVNGDQEQFIARDSQHWLRLPATGSVLLTTTRQLRLAYGIDAFTNAAQTVMFGGVKLFIGALLIYRFYLFWDKNSPLLKEFREVFSDNKTRGIDSLARTLSDAEPAVLYTLMFSPMIIASAMGVYTCLNVKETLSDLIKDIKERVAFYKQKSDTWRQEWWHNVFREYLPIPPLSLIPIPRSFGSRMKELVKALNWDGRLTYEKREEYFQVFTDLAQHGRKFIQTQAISGLAHLVYGNAIPELELLRQSNQFRGYSSNFAQVIQHRARALEILQQLSQYQESKPKRQQWLRVLYANYFLWWLGYSPSWRVTVLMFTFEAAQLGLSILFLYRIYESIDTVLQCGQREFVFGYGYLKGSDLFSLNCFIERLRLFRLTNGQEDIQELIDSLNSYYLERLEELDLRDKALTYEEAKALIQAIVSQGARIIKLDISQNNLTRLDSAFFQSAPYLEELNASYNRIFISDPKTFSEVKSLRNILLMDNAIQYLPGGLFSRLKKLEYLDLGINLIQNIPPDLLLDSKNIKRIKLDDNRLTELPKESIFGLPYLEEINLSLNELTQIPPNYFCSNNRLRILSLNKNRISTLSRNYFQECYFLENLGLYSNYIRRLQNATFYGLSQLKWLGLADNEISEIEPLSFFGLERLGFLGLSCNRIRALPESVFSPLINLHTLSLAVNSINIFPKNIFMSLSNLTELKFNDNELDNESMLKIYSRLPDYLIKLDISSNNITYFPEDFSSKLPKTMEEIILVNNPAFPNVLSRKFIKQTYPISITKIELSAFDIEGDALHDLVNLQHIALYLIESTRLPENLFAKNTHAKQISISGHEIREIPEGLFANQHSLVVLNILARQWNFLPEKLFYYLANLKNLSLDSGITQISQNAFINQNRLDILKFEANNVLSMPENILENLLALHMVKFSGSGFASLPNCLFERLYNVETIVLSGTRLTHIPTCGMKDLHQLSWLYIDDNEISDAGIENLFDNLPSNLTFLDLSENPITWRSVERIQKNLVCSSIEKIYLDGIMGDIRKINTTLQMKQLADVCEDERCRALDKWTSCEDGEIVEIDGPAMNLIRGGDNLEFGNVSSLSHSSFWQRNHSAAAPERMLLTDTHSASSTASSITSRFCLGLGGLMLTYYMLSRCSRAGRYFTSLAWGAIKQSSAEMTSAIATTSKAEVSSTQPNTIPHK